jgi:signal transduction histidine kinase
VQAEKGNLLVYHFAYELGSPLAYQCEDLLDEIIYQNERDLAEYRGTSAKAYRAARNSLLIFGALGVVVSVAVSFYTGQRIARNLDKLSRYARTVQRTADLSLPVPRVSRDEVGQLAEAFDHMRQSLHRQSQELAAVNSELEQRKAEMEQFLYTVSHDLKSPLVSCKGFIGLMKEDLAEGNHNELFDSAERVSGAVDKLNQIIDGLLLLSRMGRKPLILREVDVHALLVDLREALAKRLQAAHAELRIADHLPRVVADATDVRRVFENLITNAIKYACGKPGSVIEVGGTVTPSEVRYFVRDYGPGIRPEYHERVFGLFQRLDGNQEGTGLGLASVAKAMRMHGGRAWVESVPEAGATFWLAFPFSGSQSLAEAETASVMSSSVSGDAASDD